MVAGKGPTAEAALRGFARTTKPVSESTLVRNGASRQSEWVHRGNELLSDRDPYHALRARDCRYFIVLWLDPCTLGLLIL